MAMNISPSPNIGFMGTPFAGGFIPGTSSSTSSPTVVQTPQNAIIDRLSGVSEQYAGQLYDWASRVYEQTNTLTDQVINNYLDLAQRTAQFGQNQISRYENVFQPLENQLIQDANTYASAPRIASEMGRAEAESMQGSMAGLHNAEAQLEQFGVDPSAGRYRGLEEAANVQAGATAAAAGTQARRATEDTGRQLRSQAIGVGQNYPAAAINAANAGYQGLAGAVNSKLAAANTGAALMTAPKGYLDTAMQVKLPPVGQESQSKSTSPGSGGGGGSKSPQEPKDKQEQPQQARMAPQNPFGGQQIGSPRPSGTNPPPMPGQPDPSQFDDINLDTGNFDYLTGGSDGTYYPTGWPDAGPNYQYGSDYADFGSGDTGATGWPDQGDNYQYGSDYADFGSDGNDSGYNYPNDFSPADTYGWFDSGPDTSSAGGYDYPMDYSSGDWADYGDYARGGPVPRGPGGGAVPSRMSPSRGRVTDDVPATIPQTGGRAQLNAGEFVLPRDVVAWKGQEVFQKMIAQARRARVGAPAKPSR
jgi:hypothetical protein